MHDDVLNKAESVSADAQAVAGDREQVESIKEDVTALQQQTRENAESAKSDKESAAGYARAAEQSRNYAAEAEENIRALTSGFDTHVEEKKQDAQDEIEKSRKAAVQVIASQQVLSQNAVSHCRGLFPCNHLLFLPSCPPYNLILYFNRLPLRLKHTLSTFGSLYIFNRLFFTLNAAKNTFPVSPFNSDSFFCT